MQSSLPTPSLTFVFLSKLQQTEAEQYHLSFRIEDQYAFSTASRVTLSGCFYSNAWEKAKLDEMSRIRAEQAISLLSSYKVWKLATQSIQENPGMEVLTLLGKCCQICAVLWQPSLPPPHWANAADLCCFMTAPHPISSLLLDDDNDDVYSPSVVQRKTQWTPCAWHSRELKNK